MKMEAPSTAATWRRATYIMLALSVMVFLIQRTRWVMFDLVFELCIFHIPAVFCAIIFYRLLGTSASEPKNGI